MRKIKGQGKLTKLVTSKIARFNRKHFSSYARNSEKLKNIAEVTDIHQHVNIQLVSFSSSRDFEEQVLSILSFIKYVGNPNSWIVYSDGSHQKEEITTIEAAFPFARVIKLPFDANFFNSLDEPLQSYKEAIKSYAEKYALGKKMCSYLHHNTEGTTFFLDSDIVFYEKSSILKDFIEREEPGWFLVDPSPDCLHSQYIASEKAKKTPVNAGLIINRNRFQNLDRSLSFLKSIKDNYEYFTEQTVLHILSHSNSYLPLDPKLFIVDTVDQFDFSYAYDRRTIAIRHYTGPVRHKMWQRNWKWHLSFS